MPRLTLTRATVALVFALGAPAALRAQTTTTPKVLYACYVPSSGTVYRIKKADPNQECSRSTHVQFSWTDRPAPDVVTVFGEVRTVKANTNGEAIVICPAGSYVVGGGHQLITFSDAAQPVIYFSGPMLDPADTAWMVSIHNTVPNTVDVKMRAFARCMR